MDDKRTRATLNSITRNIPQHLIGNITKEIVDDTEEHMALQLLKSPDISQYKKRKIRKLLEQGAFRQVEVVENEAVVKELDEYHTKEISKARRSGKLLDPNKDKFIRERNWRIKNREKLNA
jgi:hypothetical protein